MDNLDLCAIAAEKAGMSYGKYMAQKERQQRGEPVRPPVAHLECERCGKLFPVWDRIKRRYCGDHCRKLASEAARRAREKAREN